MQIAQLDNCGRLIDVRRQPSLGMIHAQIGLKGRLTSSVEDTHTGDHQIE
jgi:hypothetical protein